MRGAVLRLFGKSTAISESFPELIKARLVVGESPDPSDRATYECDVEQMRENSEFINRIVNNHSRYSTYISLQEQYLERLRNINLQLEGILNGLGK